MRVILVHGTFNGADTDAGTRWWQQSGAMSRELEAAGHSVSAFQWSGGNSDRARMKAARALAKTMAAALNVTEPVAIIAHSHGGNVAREALLRLRPSQRRLIHMLTVGTPFFDRTRSWLSAFVGRETPWIGLICLFALATSGVALAKEASSWAPLMLTANTLVLAVTGPSWMFLSLYRWLHRRSRYQQADRRITAVTHTDDEAVACLSLVGRSVITAVSPAQAARLFVSATTWPAALVVAYLVASGVLTTTEFGPAAPVWERALAIALLFPLLFAAGFLLLRGLLSLVASAISPLLAPVINNLVSSSLKGAAFGLDGQASIDKVSQAGSSASFLKMPMSIEAKLANHANNALSMRIAGVRRILSQGATPGAQWLNSITTLMSWDELIHTAYFRVPEARAYILHVLADLPSVDR